MITRIELCLRDTGIAPALHLLSDVMAHVKAGRILSMAFYSEPWDTQKAAEIDGCQDATEEFASISVKECLQLVKDRRPTLATIDLLHTPFSFELSEALAPRLIAEFDSVEATSILVSWGRQSVEVKQESGQFIWTVCIVAFQGDGCPNDPYGYMEVFLELNQIKAFRKMLREKTGEEWLPVLVVE